MEEGTSEERKVEKQGSVENSKKSLILRVGKKIAITGVVISSAPFVIPPLLVVSAIGFAFAVPFGLLFASYACTEKVMSKLLSRPRAERIEEGEGKSDGMEREEEEFEEDAKRTLEMRIELIKDENETGEVVEDMDGMVEGYNVEEGAKLVEDVKGVVEEEDEGIEENVVEEPVGGIDDKQEEEKLEEDVKEELEMTSEFIGDENETGEVGAEEENQLGGGITRDFEVAVEDTDGMMEGRGYKEGFNVEGEEKFVEDVKGVIGEERGNEGIVVEEPEEEKLVREDNGFVGDETIEEREIPVEDISNSFEKVREPVKATERVIQEYTGEEDMNKPMEEEMRVKEHLDNIDEEENPVKQNNEVIEADEEVETPVEETIKNLEEEDKLIRETESGAEETTGDYILYRSIRGEEVPELCFEERGNEVNDDIPVQEEKPLEGTLKGVEENGYKEDRVLDEKLKSIEVDGMADERMDDNEADDMVEEEELLVKTKEMTEGRRIGETEDSMVEEEKPIIEGKVVKAILIKDNLREIADESGLDLFDEETAFSEQCTFVIDETNEYRVSPAMERNCSSQSVEVDSEPQNVSSNLPSAAEGHSSGIMGEESVVSVVHSVLCESVESVPAQSACDTETAIPSKEVLYSEKKIWELINAMRKIVGYKGDIQPNLSEELKALYIFTGVEPPVSSKDPLDIVEVNDKLRLLMAIIGVK